MEDMNTGLEDTTIVPPAEENTEGTEPTEPIVPNVPRKVNYKSDFDFLVTLRDLQGSALEFLQFDFTGRVKTVGGTTIVDIRHNGEEWVNCVAEGHKLHVVVDKHPLVSGFLMLEMQIHIPDNLYPDGIRNVTTVHELNIELVTGNGDDITDVDVEFLAPYIGASTYDDAVRNGYEGTSEEFYRNLADVGKDIEVALETDIDELFKNW